MIHYHSSVNMPELADKSVHCVITSPPYPGIKKWDQLFESQGCGPNEGLWMDSVSLIALALRECHRVLIPGGILCLNIGDATRTINGQFQCWPNFAALTICCKEMGFTPLIPIFWKKISNRPNAFLGSGFLPVNAYVSQDHEYIAIFRKGGLRRFDGDEKSRRKLSTFSEAERDLWFQQVWQINGRSGAGKDSGWPQEIPYRLMRMFSIIGDTILDPFCGSGEEELYNKWGRNFIGYEIKRPKIAQ